LLFVSFLSLVFFPLELVAKNTSACAGSPNFLPIITQEPVMIKQVPNGMLYTVDGNGVISPPLSIAHLYGTAHEMGLAYGELLADQIKNLVNETFVYFEQEIEYYIPFIPVDLRDKIATEGVYGILDAVYAMARPYIPERYIQEMKGISEGSNVSYADISRVSMIPEAIKAQCSMVGAWGIAVPSEYTLVQLRALDWSTNGPFQKYPVLLVYHPSEEGHVFSTLGWSGFVGSITGYGYADVGICEKVWYGYDGKYNHFGKPFTFVLRDILQFSETKEEAIQSMQEAERTCAIFVGVGDSQSNQMDVIEYSFENVTVWNGTDYPVYNGHPYIKDVIYVDKYVQPSQDPCLAELLQYSYGNITSLYLFQNVAAQLQTGDMHVAVYDYKNRFIYVSNAAVYIPNQPQLLAYQRPYIRLNMNDLFNIKL